VKTNLLCVLRTPRLRAAYNYGYGKSGRMHVTTPAREVIRECWGMCREHPHSQRLDRRALYLGCWAGLRSARHLMASFNL
jgi:hypothetical protein